ncbi:RecA family protein [Serratia marcescens]|nr:RecA family protein [Serratia marcescens]
MAAKIISKAGAWYSYREERLGQGRENTVAWLREHPALFADIEAQVRTHYLSGQAELPPVSKRPAEDVAALTDDALTDDAVGHDQ